ncbi:MAG: amidohydrolase family protein, partial [Acidobacteriota bacterium]
IQRERISFAGPPGGVKARRTIDAAGMVVCPGFIDMHTHSEYALVADGRGLSKIHQGVTTEVFGEGSSPGPRRAGMNRGARRYGVEPDWRSLREYFDRIQEQGISGNVMSYVAAGQLRRYVIGQEHRKPTSEELEQMKTLLAQAMEDGAIGLVAALETPGQTQPSDAVPDTAELIELGKVVAQYGGIYGSHIRDQGARLLDSIAEAAEIGEKAGVPAEIFHLKAAGKPYFGKMKEALAAIEEARSRGVDLAADIYPYIAAAHGLSIEVPRWAHEGGTERFLERLADAALRPRIKREVTDYMTAKYYNEIEDAGGFDAVVVSSVVRDAGRYVGKTIGQIAREQGKDPADMVLDLLIEQDANVGLVMFYMSEADVTLGIQSPLTSICSDGTAISPDRGGKPHPRYYGTFPRVLGRYVREKKALGLEEAIRKMTCYPASRLGLEDRGQVREGMWADLVVFDPDRIIDRATFEDPHQFPEGIEYVLVNGTTVVEKGRHTGALPGRVLYGPGRKSET